MKDQKQDAVYDYSKFPASPRQEVFCKRIRTYRTKFACLCEVRSIKDYGMKLNLEAI